MIIWDDEGLILSSINYSETSIILKVFTRNHGVQKGFVRGAKSKKKSNIYEAGNLVSISFKSRTEDMLGIFLVDLMKPSPLLYLNDLKRFSCIISVINLLEFSLLESEPETELYFYSKNLINKIFSYEEGWIEEYIRWEVFLLKKIGFGLELSKCILSNKKTNLSYVSPKSGCAVNKEAGKPWEKKLLELPKFLISDNKANRSDLIKGFKITTYFLTKFANSIDKILPFTRSNFMDNILIK
jgi:DNA repair protein RecO (recombination protein O)